MTADEKLDESPATEESRATDETDADRSHLSGLADGSGCTEIWEHLSEQRDDESDE